MLMSSSETVSDWDWITEFGDTWVLGSNGCLTFARGHSERGMLEVFEMDPDSAVPMTPGETESEIDESATDDGPFWVRVADVAGWGVAMEYFELKASLDNIAQRASLGTESVVIEMNIKGFGHLDYLVDGEWVSSFGIGEHYDTRAGREPNLFHDALADVGLGGLDDGTLDDPPRMKHQIVGVLTMLTNTLGIRLPRDVYSGPLLTASRTERYVFHPHT
jgi:hypothetical protein